MQTYLLSLGWWNFMGSLMMFGFLNEKFGKKMLNDWTKIITTEFKLDYWGKLFMVWAIGLNIFYGAINILAVRWGLKEMMQVVIAFDILAYAAFLLLVFWGKRVGRVGDGFWATLFIFSTWLGWGIYALASSCA